MGKKEGKWTIDISLELPDVPTVQAAFFRENPVKHRYAALLNERAIAFIILHKSMLQGDEKARPKIIELMESCWRSLFEEIKGSEIITITPNKPVSYSSHEPAGKRWLATKPFHLKGEDMTDPKVWCIRFEAKHDRERKLILNKDNYTHLTRISPLVQQILE